MPPLAHDGGWSWSGRTLVYDSSTCASRILRYSFSLAWSYVSLSWCLGVRIGVVKCANPMYEHSMKSGQRVWLCLSKSADPPDAPPPAKLPQDQRVLCAVLLFDDGTYSDATNFFAARVPYSDLTVDDLVGVMKATRYAKRNVRSLTFVYGDLGERVFSHQDVVRW